MERKDRILELRAEAKELHEQRNDKVTELETLLGGVKSENRAMSEDEIKKFEGLEAEIRAIDATIAAEDKAREIAEKKRPEQRAGDGEAEKDFAAFLRGQRVTTGVELRAVDGFQSTSLNENIIPAEFSSDIIRKVVELSGIFSSITRVNSKGIYKQIVEKNRISAGWTPELQEVTASTADFTILEIGHYKLGALVKLSLEIINQSEFPIVPEVTTQMVDAFTYKAEEALIKGDGAQKPLGLMSGGTPFELASATAITADELIKIFHQLKAPFMPGARWLINRNTLCSVRLLKDANDRYLFHEGALTDGFVGYILGKPVLLSEIMPDNEFLYGDFRRAYKANVHPGMTIQMLNELYAPQGAKGVLGFMWFDGRPVNQEAYITAKAD